MLQLLFQRKKELLESKKEKQMHKPIGKRQNKKHREYKKCKEL
jgi:hypothetical protein